MMVIEYKIWDEFPHHQCGSDGTVWSRRRRSGLATYPWKQLTGTVNGHGYIQHCIIDKNSRPRTILAHHIVLSAFSGPRPTGLFACHKNGKKTDNRAANLYWGTPQDNANDRIAHGRSLPGELNPRSKFSDLQRQEIFTAWSSGESYRSIARRLGVTKSTITRICRKKAEVVNAR